MDATLSAMYQVDVNGDRTSIASRELICAMLLQVQNSARCERRIVQQIQHDMLLRWLVGLTHEDAVWNH